jgi:prepilin-type N-terminal cleavage/methylation domain-containing protein
VNNVRYNFRPCRGFTLLEVVVAMAMVAILVVPLYTSMRFAYQTRARADVAIEPARTAELAMEFIRNDIQNTLVPSAPLLNTFNAYEGVANDVVFFSTSDARDHVSANGEVKRIELTVETPPGSSEPALVRRVTRNLLTAIVPTPDDEILCRGVANFSLEYFDGTQWNPTWDSTQETSVTPVAVRVTLELDRVDGQGKTRKMQFERIFSLACTAPIDNSLNLGGMMP